MNNYEYLVRGGIDALIKWYLEFDVAHICERNVSGEISSCECCDIVTDPYCPTEHLRKWLRAEYVKPDSLDCIERDIVEYLLKRIRYLSDSHARSIARNLINRISACLEDANESEA